ncbi:MAG: hypothetical protein KDD43_11460, partial [Bdellovibrionales bacterium]|nr:hypothetical protein [Bdellovibrionales bacterium]
VAATMGTKQSICSEDYSEVLSEIAKGIVQRVDSVNLGCESPVIEELRFFFFYEVHWAVVG